MHTSSSKEGIPSGLCLPLGLCTVRYWVNLVLRIREQEHQPLAVNQRFVMNLELIGARIQGRKDICMDGGNKPLKEPKRIQGISGLVFQLHLGCPGREVCAWIWSAQSSL